MKVYTRRGDAGMTTLASATQISKADERINTLGAVEELSAQIGLAKVALTSIPGTPEHVRMLAHLQQVLSIVSAGITDARNRKYLLLRHAWAWRGLWRGGLREPWLPWIASMRRRRQAKLI